MEPQEVVTDHYFSCNDKWTLGCLPLLCGHFIERDRLNEMNAECLNLLLDEDVTMDYSPVFACSECNTPICRIAYVYLTLYHIRELILCKLRRRQ